MRRRVPAVADQPDTPKLLADRFNALEYPHHWTPTKFAVPDIDHGELLSASFPRPFPRRVVSIEKKWDHVGTQRVQRWLADLVREADACVELTPRPAFIGVVCSAV